MGLQLPVDHLQLGNVELAEMFPQLNICVLTCDYLCVHVGLGTEFRSEKIPRNRLGTVSVIPRKKVLIPRHSEFRGRGHSEARNGTERNGIPRKKLVLRNSSKIIYQNDLSVHQKSSFLTLFLKYSAAAF